MQDEMKEMERNLIDVGR
jgi:hypothetical protein